MRICFISQAFNELRGGNEVYADLFRLLKDRHQITVITDRVKDQSPYWRTEAIAPWSPSYQYALNSYLFGRAAVKKLKSLLIKERFDLILINQVTARPILEIQNLKIPAVFIIHHPVTADIELAMSESGFFEKLRWKIKYGNLKSTQKKLVRAFSHILTVSEASRQKIASDYSAESSKIHVIHNGIDTDFFRKTKPTKPKTVVAVGSYQNPRRGFPYLLEVYKRLSKLGYHINDVGRRTEKQALILESIPNVVQHELVLRESLPDLYSEASVFISTSLYEGFGLSIAEAFSCETPAVAFGVGGVIELMSKIAPELICSPRNIDEMIDKIEKNINLSSSVGQQFRQRVIDNFSLQIMAKAYEDYFYQITPRL